MHNNSNSPPPSSSSSSAFSASDTSADAGDGNRSTLASSPSSSAVLDTVLLLRSVSAMESALQRMVHALQTALVDTPATSSSSHSSSSITSTTTTTTSQHQQVHRARSDLTDALDTMQLVVSQCSSNLMQQYIIATAAAATEPQNEQRLSPENPIPAKTIVHNNNNNRMATADDTTASTVADTSITTTSADSNTVVTTEVQSPTITVTPASDDNSSASSNDRSSNSDGDENSLEMTDIELIRTLFSPHKKQHHHQDQLHKEEEEMMAIMKEHEKIESVQFISHHHVEQEEEEEHNLSLSPFSRTKLLQSGPNTPVSQHMFSSSLFRSPPLTNISSGSSASRLHYQLDHSRSVGDDEDNDDDVSLLYTETVRRTLERKERVILDLQSQLTLLQQDREQDAEKHRREMALMRGQMAHREEEMTRMRRQLLEMQHKHEMQLEQAGRAHEEVLAEERKMNTERTTALRDRLQQLIQELEQQRRRDKEHQLQLHRSQQQAELQAEEHKREQQEKQQAHEQLLKALEEQYTEQLATETERLQREHAQHMRDQADTLHAEHQQQRQKAESEHRTQISQLEERIHELQMRTSILPELERQTAQYTLLKQEHSSTKQRLHVITQQMQQVEQQMHHSREQSEQMEEMTAHMAQHNALLQQQLDKARQRATQLEERTHNAELLQGELAHLKGTVLPEQKARYDDLSQQMRAQQEATKDKFSRLSRDLHTILSMMMMVTINPDRIRDEDENEDENEDRQSADASLISLDESALFDPSDTPLFVLLDNEDNGLSRNNVDVDDQNSVVHDPSGDDDNGQYIQSGTNTNTTNNSSNSSSLVYQLYHQTRYLVADVSSLRQHLHRLDSENATSEQARLSSESTAQALQEQLLEQRGQCSDYQRTILRLEDQAAQLQQMVENAKEETRDALSQLQRQHHTVQQFHTLVMRLLKNDTSDVEEDEDYAAAVSIISKQTHLHSNPEEEDGEERKNNNMFESLIHEMTSLVQRHHRLHTECLRRGKILDEQLQDTQKQLENTRRQLHSAREGMERQRAEQERLRLEVLEQQSQTHEQQMDTTVRQHTQQLQKLDQRYSELQSAARDLSLRHRKLSMSHELLEREVRELSDERHALVNGIRLLVRGIRPMRQHIQDLRMQKHLLADMCHRTKEQLHQLHRTVDKYCNRVLPQQQQGDTNSHHRISLRAVVIAVVAHNRMLRLVRSCGSRDHNNANQGTVIAATISLQHGQERIHLLSMGHDSSLQRHMQHDTVPLHLLTDDVVQSDDPHTVVPCFLQLCSLFDPRTTQQIMSGSIGIGIRDDGDGGHDGGISGTLMMHALRQGLQRMKSLIGGSGTGRERKSRDNMEDPTRRARHKLRAWRQYCTDLQHRHTQQQRRVGELQREMEQMNSSHADVVQLLERRGQLVEYMEDRIRTLEAEGLRTVPTEKHTKLHNEMTEAKRQIEAIKRELTDAKRLSSKWSSELEETSAKVRRQQRRISELEDEVKICKEVELVEATAQLRRERDRTVKLQQENRKFRFLVQEMQNRLFIENGGDRTEQNEVDVQQIEDATESTSNDRAQRLDNTEIAGYVQERKKGAEQTRVSDLLVEEIERDIEMARAELLELKNAQPHTY